VEPGKKLSARAPLDANQKYQTSYCIPLWLRDEQIKLAVRRPEVGRIKPHAGKRQAKIAVVGFGPSLQHTWEEIKKFKYVITCSGAHRFLIDKGIIPSWHVEVDPREHKVKLLGEPHKDVTYLPAATCHPAYFEQLKKAGVNTKLWHVFSTEEDALRSLPPEEWAVLGGSDVGLRAAVLARFFGFTNLHMFGIDGCGEATKTHAADHPNAPKAMAPLEFPAGSGKMWQTTVALMECAKQWGHELNQMPDVKPTFHGEGLVQTMWKDYKPANENVEFNMIAVTKPKLVSDEYRALNRKLHENNLSFGVGGGQYAKIVIDLVTNTKSRSVLDYGCGKGYLAKALPFPIWEYDPCVSGKDESPRPAEVVACLDVLEHIEEDRVDFVLKDLARCTRKVGYFIIHTGPSTKTLEDGRNAHILQKPKEWWEEQLGKYFNIGMVTDTPPLLHVVVGPKRKKVVTSQDIVAAALALQPKA
jgi:hypothetical protein